MQYISHYQSPVGAILIAADDIGLTGLWFEGQKYFALHLDAEHEEKEIPLFGTVKRWLDIYFSGKEPGFTVRFSERSVGNSSFHFIWQNHDLRRNCKEARRQKRFATYVFSGHRRCGGAQ